MARFDGKTIVVTGGTGFLGTGVCERLLDEGAYLVLAWVNDEELERFPFADRCTMSQVDLTNESAVEAFFEAVGPVWGSIHIAGGFAMSPIESTSLAEMGSDDATQSRNDISLLSGSGQGDARGQYRRANRQRCGASMP